MQICGLGLTETGTTSVLRQATVPIATSNFCEQHGTYYDTTQLCAGDGTGRDAVCCKMLKIINSLKCQGDSGGPAYHVRNGIFVLYA